MVLTDRKVSQSDASDADLPPITIGLPRLLYSTTMEKAGWDKAGLLSNALFLCL